MENSCELRVVSAGFLEMHERPAPIADDASLLHEPISVGICGT